MQLNAGRQSWLARRLWLVGKSTAKKGQKFGRIVDTDLEKEKGRKLAAAGKIPSRANKQLGLALYTRSPLPPARQPRPAPYQRPRLIFSGPAPRL